MLLLDILVIEHLNVKLKTKTMILLNVTIKWWGIILICLFVFTVIFSSLWAIGKFLSDLNTKYEKRYNYLEMLVKCSTVDPISYKHIKALFEEIKDQFKEVLNKEKMEVLEAEFYRKFEQYNLKQPK